MSDAVGAGGGPARPVANAIIAGVNKAGTTSLFVTLSAHPDVAPSSVKETGYFLPARWGRPLEPRSVYEGYWADAGAAPVRLEATPAYFPGGPDLVAAVREVCGSPKILVVVREPVARLLSYFRFQKARLRIPESMTLDEYLAHADALSDADFRDPANEVWFGARGGCYADFLPDWTAAFGRDVHLLAFEDLVGRPEATVAGVARFLGLDPAGLSERGLESENRTTGFRNRRMQRLALGFNDRFEPFLRRHHGLKRRLRGLYLRVNGRSLSADEVDRAGLRERYADANARLARQWRDLGCGPLPEWLDGSVLDR